MGVPSLFQYLRKKYRRICSSSISAVGEDDGRERSLYIDMNGILHQSSHPDDLATKEVDDETLYARIASALDDLVFKIKPSDTLYLAMDGVAPRAKMNQQRMRRFTGARERAEMKEMEAELRAEMSDVPEDDCNEFDSNGITPGTQFMWKCSEYVRTRLIPSRLATAPEDGGWAGMFRQLIFSGGFA
jgi:5'-3' exonuclease